MYHILSLISTITIAQLIAHALGDCLLQSGWMAENKTEAWLPAVAHGVVYAVPFVVILHPSIASLAVIEGSHILIDHYRLARHMCWAKSWQAPQRPRPWKQCSKTSFDPETPEYMAQWLMIITDNLIHVPINGLALLLL